LLIIRYVFKINFITWALPAAWAFRYKSSLSPHTNPAHAVGFSLQSLTRPPHNISKTYFARHHGFFQGSSGGYSQ